MESRSEREVPESPFRSPRGALLLVSCRSGGALARRVARLYHGDEGERSPPVRLLEHVDHRFSDTETRVRLEEDVSGTDAFLFQSLYDPTSDLSVDQNLMALLVAARTLREWGANRVTAVVPYLAYARQDKPTRSRREPTTARLVADLAETAGVDRIVVFHPHFDQVKGFFGATPVDVLDPDPVFADELAGFRGRDDTIVVAPDAGAAKLVAHLARRLELDSAVASKVRPRAEQAEITDVVGRFEGKRRAIVPDDMISSGGTAEALVQILVERHRIEQVLLLASHCLCTAPALERLVALRESFGLERLVVTDSVPLTAEFRALPFLSVRSLGELLAGIVRAIHEDRSLAGSSR